MPKVFADVPSQRELEDARRASKSAGGWIALLLILVIGAGGLIAWEVALGRPQIAQTVAGKNEELKAANAKLAQAQKDLSKEADNNRRLSAAYEPFKAIGTAEVEITDYKKQIAERLGQYPPARDRTRIEFKENWKAFDSADAWKGGNKAEVTQDLQNRSKLLISLLQKIDEIKPPTTTGPAGPACTDATKCAPTGKP